MDVVGAFAAVARRHRSFGFGCRVVGIVGLLGVRNFVFSSTTPWMLIDLHTISAKS